MFKKNYANYYDDKISYPHYKLIFNNNKYIAEQNNIKSGEENSECWIKFGIEDSENNY